MPAVSRGSKRTSSVARHALIPLLIAASLVAAVAFVSSGIRLGGDTGRYTEGAEALLSGHGVSGKALAYSGYVAVVAAMDVVGLGLEGVVFLQLVLAGIAAFAIYLIARDVAGPVAGVAAVLLLALETEHAVWHSYILTDSVYMSLLPIAALLVHRAAERGSWWYGAALVVLAALASVRPNGWVVAAAALVYWIVRSRASSVVRAALSGLVLVGLVLSFSFLPPLAESAQAEDPKEMLFDGRVIWGLRDVNHAMPGAEDADSAVDYVLRHPVASGHLGLARVATELAAVRPYYSDFHNLKNLMSMLPLYALATLGGWVFRKSRAVRLVVALVSVHIFLIAVTFADYDGRFLMHFISLVIILAGIGARVVWDVFRRRLHSRAVTVA